VAGISLVTNYRDQFAQEVRNGGVDGLIAPLRPRTSRWNPIWQGGKKMIEREGGRLIVKVPLSWRMPALCLRQGVSPCRPGEQVFDFSVVTEADSSALAVMLGWLRAAALSRSTVKFAHIPTGVRSLAGLYGVTELLPLV
jgi:phospholipid transport system transporter-binding protein